MEETNTGQSAPAAAAEEPGTGGSGSVGTEPGTGGSGQDPANVPIGEDITNAESIDPHTMGMGSPEESTSPENVAEDFGSPTLQDDPR